MLGSQADSFRLVLGHELRYGAPAVPQYSMHAAAEDGAVYDCVDVAWTEDDKQNAVLERLTGDADLRDACMRCPAYRSAAIAGVAARWTTQHL